MDVRSHGLRKLCLIRLAEAGCTVNQIAAISGHKDLREIQLYIDAADRKRLARDGIAQLWKMKPKWRTNRWPTLKAGWPIRRNSRTLSIGGFNDGERGGTRTLDPMIKRHSP